MATEVQSRQSRTLLSLLDLFPSDDLGRRHVRTVPPDDVPDPYRGILVHRNHMTVTLERFHGSRVHLVVLDRKQEDHTYARRLILTAGPQGRVILAGIMRFHLAEFCPTVRRQVIEEKSPLGRILIECEVLRQLEPRVYVRVRLSPGLRAIFRAPEDVESTYGRTAIIRCDGKPTVELLEIVAPNPPARARRPLPTFRGEQGCPGAYRSGQEER